MTKPTFFIPARLILFVFLALTACASSPLTLDQKLAIQWDRYDAARRLVVDRVSDSSLTEEKRMVSRTEWEKILTLDGAQALTENDLALLRTRQLDRAIKARESHLAAPRPDLDFDRLRSLPAGRREAIAASFCKGVPKGGMLHVHPTGTVRRETASRLMNADNPVLPLEEFSATLGNVAVIPHLYEGEISWLKNLGGSKKFSELGSTDQGHYLDLFSLPPGTHPFWRFDAVFPFVMSAVHGSAENLFQIYRDFVVHAAQQGVFYVEFTTGGVSRANLRQYADLAQKIEKELGVKIRFNRSFSRGAPVSDQRKKVEDLLAESSPWVVGIDLLGNETYTPALETGQVAYASVLGAVEAGRSSLHRTQHAGELGDPRNPRDALILGAERLGHGVKLVDDPVALEYAALHHVAVEVNLTSNLRLQTISDLKKHPFTFYLRQGVPVSLSTDDEGIFATDMNQDCTLALLNSDLTYDEFKQMAMNSLETSFLPESDKKPLLQRLSQQFGEFESHFQLKAQD